MFNVAAFGPGDAGVKVTDTVVEAPPARVVVPGAPAENCAASAPAIVNGAQRRPPNGFVLVIVTDWVAALPAVTSPKSTVAGVAVTVGRCRHDVGEPAREAADSRCRMARTYRTGRRAPMTEKLPAGAARPVDVGVAVHAQRDVGGAVADRHVADGAGGGKRARDACTLSTRDQLSFERFAGAAVAELRERHDCGRAAARPVRQQRDARDRDLGEAVELRDARPWLRPCRRSRTARRSASC